MTTDMPKLKIELDCLSWKTIKNSVSKRLINDSLTHTFHEIKKIQKRTKFINRELKKHSGLRSYRKYVEIKTALLKKLPADEVESDFEPTINRNHPFLKSLTSSDNSSDNEDENEFQDSNSIAEKNSTSTLFEEEVQQSSKKKSSTKASRKANLETPSSCSSDLNLNKTSRITISRGSALHKLKSTQSTLTSFFKNKRSPQNKESSPNDKKSSTVESKTSSRKTRLNSQEISTPSTSKSPINEPKYKADVIKPRNKTREDVKKNLSSIIGNFDTSKGSEENLERTDTHNESEFNLSNVIAVAQSTQYPDDSSDFSDKTENKTLTNVNKKQPKDSGIDSCEELTRAKTRELQLKDGSDFVQNEDHREKNAVKIIGSEIVNKKYKILNKNQVVLDEKKQKKSEKDDILEMKYAPKNDVENEDNSEESDEENKTLTAESKKLGFENNKNKKEEDERFIEKEENETSTKKNSENLLYNKRNKPVERKNLSNEKMKTPVKKGEKGKLSVEKDEKSESMDKNEKTKALIDKSEKNLSNEKGEKLKTPVKKGERRKLSIEEGEKIDSSIDKNEKTKSSIDKNEKVKSSMDKREAELSENYEETKLSNEKDKKMSIEKSKKILFSEKSDKMGIKNDTDVEDDLFDSDSSREGALLIDERKESSSDEDEKKSVVDFNESEKIFDKTSNNIAETDLEFASQNSRMSDDDSQVSFEFKNRSKKVLTQFVQRKDSFSDDDDKEEDNNEMKLSLEIDEPEERNDNNMTEEESQGTCNFGNLNNKSENFCNFDDDMIDIDEHKIEAADEKTMSAEAFKTVSTKHRLAFDVSSSDEEITPKKKQKPIITKLVSSDSDDTELEDKEKVKKTSPKKKDAKKKENEKSKSNLEDSVKSESEKSDDSECEIGEKLSKKKKSVSFGVQETVNEKSPKKKKKISDKNEIESDSEDENLREKERKKNFNKKSLEKEDSGDSDSDLEEKGNLVETEIQPSFQEEPKEEKDELKEEKSEEEDESRKERSEVKNKAKKGEKSKEENRTKKGDKSEKNQIEEKRSKKSQENLVEEDSDFQNYVKDGMDFYQQKDLDFTVENQNKKSKKEKTERKKSKDSNNKRKTSTSEIIDEVPTQNGEYSQIISETDTQVESESRKSKKTETNRTQNNNEDENLNYVLSGLKRKSNRYSDIIDQNIDLNKSDKPVEDWKLMSQLSDLIEKENLVELNLPSSISVNDILDGEAVWLFEIPKKELTTDLIGKKLLFDGSNLKLDDSTYQTSCRKVDSMTCVLSSKKGKTSYKAVYIRPICSVLVRSKNAVMSSTEKDVSKKIEKSTDILNASSSDKNEELIPESTSEKKIKKSKKLATEKSSSKDNKSENNESAAPVKKKSAQKRKGHFLSDSEEDKKSDSKSDTKRMKFDDIDGFLLDEKPPVVPPINNTNQGPSFSSDSDVEIADGEIKPKKEKREKVKKSPLTIVKERSKKSPKKEKEAIFKSPLVSKKGKKVSEEVKEKLKKHQAEDVSDSDNSQARRKKWKAGILEKSEETEENSLPKPKKSKKKSKQSFEEVKNTSVECQVEKTESLISSESEFEVKDRKKKEKKLKKKRQSMDRSLSSENSKDQKDIVPKEEKPKKKEKNDFDY